MRNDDDIQKTIPNFTAGETPLGEQSKSTTPTSINEAPRRTCLFVSKEIRGDCCFSAVTPCDAETSLTNAVAHRITMTLHKKPLDARAPTVDIRDLRKELDLVSPSEPFRWAVEFTM